MSDTSGFYVTASGSVKRRRIVEREIKCQPGGKKERIMCILFAGALLTSEVLNSISISLSIAAVTNFLLQWLWWVHNGGCVDKLMNIRTARWPLIYRPLHLVGQHFSIHNLHMTCMYLNLPGLFSFHLIYLQSSCSRSGKNTKIMMRILIIVSNIIIAADVIPG